MAPEPEPSEPMTQEEAEALEARVHTFFTETLPLMVNKAHGDAVKEDPLVHVRILTDILVGGLLSLRHYIEDPEETEVSWTNPWTELRFTVEWDWDHGGPVSLRDEDIPPEAMRAVMEALRKGEDPFKVAQKDVASLGASLLSDTLIPSVLHGLTNFVAVHVKNGKEEGCFFLDPTVKETLDALPTMDERAEMMETLLRPFSFGGLEAEDENGEPVLLTPLDHEEAEPGTVLPPWLEEAEKRSKDLPKILFHGEAGGVPIKGSVVIMVHPLVVDEDSREAYFPIVVGLVFAPVDGDVETTVDPSTWPAEDVEEFWKAILEAPKKPLEIMEEEERAKKAAERGEGQEPETAQEPPVLPSTALVPTGAPSPERRATAGVAFGHTVASAQAITIVHEAHRVHLPRKWSAIPRWDALVDQEVRDLREEEGDRAFEDLRRTTKNPEARGPLLRRVQKAGGKEVVVLTTEAQDRLRRRAGLGRGYLDVDRYGQERLYRLFEVRDGGLLEVGLSWMGAAGPLVDEWRAEFKRRAEELGRELKEPSLFAELDEEKRVRVDRLMANLVRMEDGRRIMEAILGQVGKQRRNPVEIPAEAFRVLLWPERAKTRKWPKNWKQRVEDALTALHALTFSFRTYHTTQSRGYGSMVGNWYYHGLGPGDHGDGVYRIDVSSGFIGCLQVFQSGKQSLRTGVDAISFHFTKDLTKEERAALGWGRGRKPEDTFVTFDAGRAFYSASAGLTPTQENLLRFLEARVTRRGDTARTGNKAAQVHRRAKDAKESRLYTSAFCPLLPEGQVFHGALGNFTRNPEAGFTIAGAESRAARHAGGLLHHMGHALPPGAARTQRAEVITRALVDLHAVVVDYLGGVVVGHEGKRWVPLENFRDLDERTLTKKLKVFVFLPQDWEEKRRTQWEELTGRRVTEDPEEAERETWDGETIPELGGEVVTEKDGFRAWPLHLRLRATMRDRDLRQKDLAAVFGVSEMTVSYWLTGKKPIPQDVAPLAVRWVENGTPPTAEELAVLAVRRSKKPGTRKGTR